MELFKSKKNIIFIIIIIVLILALAALSTAFVLKSREYNAIQAMLYDNNGSLADITSQIEAYKAEIESYSTQIENEQQTNSDLQAKLDAALAEKERLEKENSSIRAQLEQLAEQKRIQQEAERLASLMSKGAALQSGEMPTDKVCYLTFDDGPSDNTLRIIEILKRYNDIKATFFVVGTSRLDYLPQLSAAGHTIGLHSNTHRFENIYQNEAAFLADLKAISDSVLQRTGVESRVTRFPGGGSNMISKDYCVGIMTRLTQLLPSMGYSYFDWNVDSGDASGKNVNPVKITQNVLSQAEGKQSICVLMHDTSAKSTTVQALPQIIEGLIVMGYRFEPITPETYGFHHSVNN